MGSVIAWIASSRPAQFVINFFLGKLLGFIKELVEKAKRRAQIDEEAKKSLEPLAKAQTAEEIDRAARDALNKL